MTAILAIESGKLDNEITVPEIPDFGTTGAVTIHLGKGEKYTLRSLVEVMLVASANDAAYVIADAVGCSAEKFVNQMNEKAKELGMSNTTFKNPHGLDEDGHLVTAEDMAKLACYAMQNETFRQMVLVQQVNWQASAMKNRCLLPISCSALSRRPPELKPGTAMRQNAHWLALHKKKAVN